MASYIKNIFSYEESLVKYIARKYIFFFVTEGVTGSLIY